MTSQTPRAVAEAICGRGRITDDDVRALRRAIWGGGHPVDRAAAEALLALQREVPERAPAWADLYVEALSEFFLDDDTVPVAGAELLAREVVADGVVEDATELRLLLNLVFRSRHCPPRLVALARDALRASVVASAASFYGKGPRRPGTVDADDVEAIRRLIYASGGADGIQVGEGEALWLAELDRATARADNAPVWRDLYVKALAMYLLLGRGTGEHVDAAAVDWIRHHLSDGQRLTPNARALVEYLRREARSVDPGLTALAA